MTQTIPPAFSPRAVIESYRVAVVWPAELVGGGIVTSSWSASPPGLELTAPATSGGEASVRVAGGTAQTRYVLRNVIEVERAGGTETYAVSVPIDCLW